jgi:hypothetical protein
MKRIPELLSFYPSGSHIGGLSGPFRFPLNFLAGQRFTASDGSARRNVEALLVNAGVETWRHHNVVCLPEQFTWSNHPRQIWQAIKNCKAAGFVDRIYRGNDEIFCASAVGHL